MKEVTVYQTDFEIEHMKECLSAVKDVSGDLIEVGVFEGGTAKVIADAFKDRNVYLFDTFEGFTDSISTKDGDSKVYSEGDCSAQIEIAQEYLKDNKNVKFFKGEFPKTSAPVKDKKFCFAHIDVDLYGATKETLEFVYPRMVKGGMILIHDYPVHEGVKKAVDNFLEDKKNETVQYGHKEGLPRQLSIKI